MKLFYTSLLYVLSGTGNTFRVACWIKNYLEINNIKTFIKFIEDANFPDNFHDSKQHLTAVLFPTHGFMPPWSMIKFLFRMPRQKKLPVITVATRGTLWFGPIKIPGAAGFSNFFAALVLLCKGYNVRGFFSLDMASNMTNLHPSLTPHTMEKISEKTKDRIDFFLTPIISGKRVIFH